MCSSHSDEKTALIQKHKPSSCTVELQEKLINTLYSSCCYSNALGKQTVLFMHGNKDKEKFQVVQQYKIIQ